MFKKVSISLVILPLLAFLFLFGVTGVASAHSLLQPQQHTTGSIKNVHPLGCTPNQYHRVDSEPILDQTNSNISLGIVSLYADGCGWVQAQCAGYLSSSRVNHCELHDYSNNATLVAAPAFNGTNYSETYHYQTNGKCVDAFGVLQDQSQGFWGSKYTSCSKGTN